MGNCNSSTKITPIAISSIKIIPTLSSPKNSSSYSSNEEHAYFSFYIHSIKNTDITVDDYHLIKESWSQIINNKLYMFYTLKAEEKITSSDSLSWVYDTFFKNIYVYNPSLKNIFHTNIKLQAKAFVNIIKYFIDTAHKISHNKKVDYMSLYKTHQTYPAIFYFEICHVLIETFRECLCNLFDDQVEFAWRKLLSIFIKNFIFLLKNNKRPFIRAAL